MDKVLIVFAAALVTCSTLAFEENCINGWPCRDGTCIELNLTCNGAADCPDGSDEDFLHCYEAVCSESEFQCAYGACVRLNATCDGVKDCVDNSDELLFKCRNKTSYEECLITKHFIGEISRIDYCDREERLCNNGQRIGLREQCDGIRNCDDGSDETVENCSDVKRCIKSITGEPVFRCKYGACVSLFKVCNNINDCADGSDEHEEICFNTMNYSLFICLLPPYPENGYYIATPKTIGPGDSSETTYINFFCNSDYKLVGTQSLNCTHGKWSDDIPKCLSKTQTMCQLRKHPSVEYICLLNNSSNQDDAKECDELVEDGTMVQPKCREPNYYYTGLIHKMQCKSGEWDRVIIVCREQCGLTTPKGDQQIVDGQNAKHGELPWHVGIYRKTSNPYKQICGGSLISNTIVVSAAHCFWQTDKQMLAADFAVAVGKLYRPWSDPQDKDAQTSDVRDIKIPALFRGSAGNYQADIALLMLTSPFEIRTYVRPVCIDFEYKFMLRQLRSGASGKVAGWGVTAGDGVAAPTLQVATLPYISPEECLDASPPDFIEYINSDKICAGFNNGTGAVCMGDSGGGLVFAATDEFGTQRYYLRGVASTAPSSNNVCNAYTFTTFTKLSSHEHFIKMSLEQLV